MVIAAGRLRASVSFSGSLALEPNEKKLYDKARAYAERSLIECYPPRIVRKFDTVKVIDQSWWKYNGLLDSRTATLLSERRAVLRTLDGRSPRSLGGRGVRVPRWRRHKRRMLERVICTNHRIHKWW